MVYRVYVEKKAGLANEAESLKKDIISFLGIQLSDVRLLNRYDVENIDKDLFEYAKNTVFSEPQLDIATETLENTDGATVFAVESLPGQFDQRADSAAQCIQIISQGEKPLVRTAKVYVLKGDFSDAELAEIKKYVINPVESREATLDVVETLKTNYDIPETVETLEGFISLTKEQLSDFIDKYGLAMDIDDIVFCQEYFLSEKRDPTITEIRMMNISQPVMQLAEQNPST